MCSVLGGGEGCALGVTAYHRFLHASKTSPSPLLQRRMTIQQGTFHTEFLVHIPVDQSNVAEVVKIDKT